MAVVFSLVIPTFNRCEALRLTLERLQAVEFPCAAFEVLVVDDGCTDDTPQILESFAGKLPLRVFRQNNGGAAAARNRGIRESRGLYCLFIDDDVLASPALLREHAESHRGYLKRMVRGPVINFPAPPPPPAEPLWKHYSMNYLCTSNASLAREHLLQAGLFDESFDRWEDAELGVRLKRLGVERHFNLKAYVHHWKPDPTPEERLRTAERDGRSAAQLYRRYPSLRMWMRSGLHVANRVRNRAALGVCRMAGWACQDLEIEAAYLKSGLMELYGHHGSNLQS